MSFIIKLLNININKEINLNIILVINYYLNLKLAIQNFEI